MAIEILSKTKARLIVSVGSASKGTRRRVTKTVTYTKKKELERMYRAFEDEVRHNPMVGTTVAQLVESYVSNAEIRGLSANTIRGYKTAQKRLNSAFEGVLARELTTYQLDDFIARMAKKYAPKTIRSTVALLDAAYQRAVRAGQLSDNPCAGVTLPKQTKAEIQTLDEEQLVKFLQLLEEQTRDIRVGYLLCLMCGLRRGEVLGLTESDINLAFRTISINKARYVIDGKDVIQEPKTARSRRTLALPKVLADQIALLIQEHRACEWYHSDYLIQGGFGDPICPSYFSSKIRRMGAGVSVHGLRHTFATLLNAEGTDIARISAELGHSNLTTTLNLYTHVFGDVSSSSRGIADKMDGIFGEGAQKGHTADTKKTAEA